MPIHPENADSSRIVTACRDNEIVIDGVTYTSSLIVTPDSYPAAWPVQTFSSLKLDDLTDLGRFRPDVILLGTGRETKQLPESWVFSLLNQGLLIECMHNRAACGTYNLIVSEERNALLALILEEIK